jgi:hypothetical protein
MVCQIIGIQPDRENSLKQFNGFSIDILGFFHLFTPSSLFEALYDIVRTKH